MKKIWPFSEDQRYSGVAVLISLGLHAAVLLGSLHLSGRVQQKGDLSQAQTIQVSLISLVERASVEPNPAPAGRQSPDSPTAKSARFPRREVSASYPPSLSDATTTTPSAIQTSHPTSQAVAASNGKSSAAPVDSDASTGSTRGASESASTTSHVTGIEVKKAQPDYAYNPQPDYPLLMRDQGIGGVVWLRAMVEPDGTARDINLLKSSGYRLLDEAAMRAVRSWRFIPARRGDQTLASWVEFPIRFSLQG